MSKKRSTKMAYRVEYPPYKIQLSSDGKSVVGFSGNRKDGMGINISFVKPDHSEYFASERSEEQLKGMRTVQFEITQKFYDNMMQKVEGKSGKKGEKNPFDKLPKPTWSDGANLDSFTKKTALGFKDAWLDVLQNSVVQGTARVDYHEKEEQKEEQKGNQKEKESTKNDFVWAYTDDKPEYGYLWKTDDIDKLNYNEKYLPISEVEETQYYKDFIAPDEESAEETTKQLGLESNEGKKVESQFATILNNENFTVEPVNTNSTSSSNQKQPLKNKETEVDLD